FLGGLMTYAAPSTVFGTPTVNGYRRFRPNSLAPDRASWCYDHRGVMIRVLGAPGDEATRLENRSGEPAANPYLYILSHIVAGLDGIENALDPGPAEDDPYNASRPMLPTSLPAALEALEREPLFRAQLGDVFIDYFLKLKRNEAGRFAQWLKEAGARGGEESSGRRGSRTSISIFSRRMHYGAHANSGRVAAVNPWRSDAMLEKFNVSRIEGADLYDWDELVQEDRVHRLIYTDPAIFAAEM